MAKLKLTEDELSVLFQKHWAEYESQKAENTRREASRMSLRRDPKSVASSSAKPSGDAPTVGAVGGGASGPPYNNNVGDKGKKVGTWTRRKSDKPAR